MRFWLVICLWLWPALAYAGAWPKERWDGYLSLTLYGSADTAGELPEAAIYAELGLGNNLTLGLDLYKGQKGQTDHALLFMTRAITPNRRFKLAFTTGVGLDKPYGLGERVLGRLALHAGWGLDRGWLAADISADWSYWIEYRLLYDPDLKADFTYGRRLTPRYSVIAQVQTGQPPGGEPFVKLAPALSITLGRRAEVLLGYTHGVMADETRKLSLGVATRF